VKTSKSLVLYTLDNKCHKTTGSNYGHNIYRWMDIFALAGPFTKKNIQTYVM
jgi:hypothetical protein